MASNFITISINRTGAMGFDIVISVDENPALQDSAMLDLDLLLFKEENCSWVTGIFDWSTVYKLGISRRSFFADPKLGQALVEQYFKICQKKFGKNLTILSKFKV